MQLLVQTALCYIGIPYRWGGKHPAQGLDCSGLVQILLQSVGVDLPGDQNAQAYYDHFEKKNSGILPSPAGPGWLLFFGKDARHITHVAMSLDSYRMIEAGGGDSSTLSLERSIEQRASVRVVPVKRRGDLVAAIKPSYTPIGMP